MVLSVVKPTMPLALVDDVMGVDNSFTFIRANRN